MVHDQGGKEKIMVQYLRRDASVSVFVLLVWIYVLILMRKIGWKTHLSLKDIKKM